MHEAAQVDQLQILKCLNWTDTRQHFHLKGIEEPFVSTSILRFPGISATSSLFSSKTVQEEDTLTSTCFHQELEKYLKIWILKQEIRQYRFLSHQVGNHHPELHHLPCHHLQRSTPGLQQILEHPCHVKIACWTKMKSPRLVIAIQY